MSAGPVPDAEKLATSGIAGSATNGEPDIEGEQPDVKVFEAARKQGKSYPNSVVPSSLNFLRQWSFTSLTQTFHMIGM